MSRGQVNSCVLAQVESNRISFARGQKTSSKETLGLDSSGTPQSASVTTKLIRIPDEARDAPRLLSVQSAQEAAKGQIVNRGALQLWCLNGWDFAPFFPFLQLDVLFEELNSTQ